SPIEVALYAKQKGLTVVGLTSVAMSSTAKTVHPGGQNLHAVCDHVLDNHGVSGDAIVEMNNGQLAGVPADASAMAGPTSTLIGAPLLNLPPLKPMTCPRAHAHGWPVVRSKTPPGGMEANIALSKKSRTRLSKLI